MPKKSKFKAEELLAKEHLSQELLSQNAIDRNMDGDQFQIAQNIYSFLGASNVVMTDSQKEQTKNQIRSSVRKSLVKRQLIRWSVAASIFLAAILPTVGYFHLNPTSDIVNYAQTLPYVKPENNTRIIFQNGEEVRVENTQSQIKYDRKGENILINSEQKIAQKSGNSASVFNTVIVPYGKRTQIILSEGTKVWLNSGSRMVYPTVFTKNKREVFIDGEAVFDVTHMPDKPFIVSTKDFDIKVLGTVFNVSAYSDDNYSRTVLEKGKIVILKRGASILSQEKIDINPGTMAVFDRKEKTFDQQTVDPQKYMSWRDGYLTFKSENLGNILKKLGRYYNMEMVITDNMLMNETFTGYLDLKNSPQEVLSVLNESTSLSYHIYQNKIFINQK